jgi:hypothetical protein
MKISEFNGVIGVQEGKKKQTHQGNVNEIMKIVNEKISSIDKLALQAIATKHNGKNLLYKIIKAM